MPSLPTNLPSKDATNPGPSKNFSFDYIRSNLSLHADAVFITPTDSFYWNSETYASLPYLPYFSNCKVEFLKNLEKIFNFVDLTN